MQRLEASIWFGFGKMAKSMHIGNGESVKSQGWRRRLENVCLDSDWTHSPSSGAKVISRKPEGRGEVREWAVDRMIARGSGVQIV